MTERATRSRPLTRFQADDQKTIAELEDEVADLEATIAEGPDDITVARVTKNVGSTNKVLRSKNRELEREVENLLDQLVAVDDPEGLVGFERGRRELAEKERDDLERIITLLEQRKS